MAAVEEDLSSQLRWQIAQAAGEKEKAKLDLESLKRAVDSHLLRLNGVLNSSEVSRERLASAVQALDVEVRSRLEADTTLLEVRPSEGTYEVLRHSLSDAQKRCQDLSSDMLRVADANEELHGTLRTLKGTNRRLVEEVQKQTEELSTLTQQRLTDMESLKRLEETFEQERAFWAQEAHRTLEEEQKRCDEEYSRMAEQLTSKLDECWRRAKAVAAKSGALRAVHGQLKAEVQSFSQGIATSLKQLEGSLVDRIAATAQQMQSERSRLQDLEHNLQVKLRAEREVRESETETWRSRHKALAGELDELIARRDREVSDLQARVEAVSATREAEAASAEAERAALHERAEGLAKDVALQEAMMQTARRKALQLESHLAQAEGERDRLRATAEALKEQVRESDEALGEAVRSNESLREQMEVQRLEAQGASERDMRLCRDMFERRVEVQAQSHMQGQVDIARKIRSLEEGIGQKAGELHAAKEALAERTRARDALQRDVLMWKAQHELAAKMRQDVERELAQFRQECLDGELRRRQDEHDELAAKLAELEKRRAAVLEEAAQLERSVQAREGSDAEQAHSVAEQRREVADELQKAKASLAEAEAGLAAARAGAAAATQQMSERRDGLEQDLTRLRTEADTERRELERKVQAERLGCESLRESFERLRDEHRTSYKAACEGPQQQISALEDSISEIQRGADAELASLRQRSERLRSRIEELEVELTRAQAKLSQTEQEVQEGAASAKLAKANHRAAREALERELKGKGEELQQVQRSITQRSDQLRALTKAGEDTRRRLLRDIEEAKAEKARRQADADRRLQALRSEYSVALEDTERSRISMLPGLGGTADSLFRENEQLRSFVGEQRAATGRLQDVGEQMQKSLASMEDRAAALRRGLQR